MDLRADLGGSGAQTMECSTDTFKQRHFRAAPCRLSPQVNLHAERARACARDVLRNQQPHRGCPVPTGTAHTDHCHTVRARCVVCVWEISDCVRL